LSSRIGTELVNVWLMKNADWPEHAEVVC